MACASCVTSPSSGSDSENGSASRTPQAESKKEFTKTFKEYGFSIKTPCVLEDVSSQVRGNFEANYGGIDNPDDPENGTAYQVAVIKLPIGFEDFSEAEQNEILDQRLNLNNAGFTNVEKVLFSDNKYLGYVGDTHHNGLKQRGVMFNKGRYIITLTVLANSDLEKKFNKFTNSFKVID